MKQPADFLREYLRTRSTMQLATVKDGQPWVCTVRFIADDNNTIYWSSVPRRRHSQEIADEPKVACAIVVQDVIGKPVIGIQIVGAAAIIQPPLNQHDIVQRYAEAFGRDAQWIEEFTAGSTEHRLYKLTPTSIYLFDEEHFPGGERQQIL